MTKEDKELLLKDLSARLQYGIKGLAYIVGEPCNINANIIAIINKSIVTDYESPMLEFINLSSKDIIIKPYLRPMSSMTEEEKRELFEIGCEGNIEHPYGIYFRFQDWLNAHYFDYRGLIEKGLALEAPEGMYK